MKKRRNRLREIAKQIQQKEEIESGLRSARKKQLHLLPPAPELVGYEFGTYYNPASSLGGDFYDFIQIDGDHLGIVIGDVTGHGIDAAIVMGMAKKAINIFAKGSLESLSVMLTANDSLYPDLDDMTFVSAFYGVLDLPGRKVDYVRAGHNPSIFYSPTQGSKVEQLRPRGLVLGMQKQEVFQQVTEAADVGLAPGDILFNYTDGIVEAKNKEGQEYGEDRLIGLIVTNAKLPIQKMVDIIRCDFEDFIVGTEQEDDVTLVALKVLESG